MRRFILRGDGGYLDIPVGALAAIVLVIAVFILASLPDDAAFEAPCPDSAVRLGFVEYQIERARCLVEHSPHPARGYDAAWRAESLPS